MRSLLRATFLLGFSSGLSAVFGLVTAKASALFLGAGGVGLLGLVQSALGLASLVGGLGLSASIVRFGSAPAARGDADAFASLRRAGWVIVAAMSFLTPALFLLFRGPVSRSMLGGSDQTVVLVLAGVVAFSIAHVMQMALLNANHRVRALAMSAVVISALSSAVQVFTFWQFGIAGVPYGVAAAALVQFLVSRVAVSTLLRPTGHASWPQVRRSTRELVAFGLPYTASAFAGAGTLLLLPALIASSLDIVSVGYFRASFAFSATYLGLILTAMSQDYYPRISAQSDAAAVGRAVNQQFRLLLLLGAPLIMFAIVFAPILLRVVYAAEFVPAVPLLRWQMIGDLFKFQAWVLSFVVLARASSRSYFTIEVAAGVLLLSGVLFSIRLFGLAGIGIGYTLAYAAYAAVVWVIVRRMMPFRWERSNVLLMIAALLLSLIIRLLPDVRVGTLDFSWGIIPAAAFATWAFIRVYREGIRPEPIVKTIHSEVHA